MSEILYRKVGKRYKPVGCEFVGFPSDGIWLVESDETGIKSSCILYLGEKCKNIPSKYAIVIKQFRDDIIKKASKKIREKAETVGISEYERVDVILDTILEFCESENKQSTLTDRIRNHIFRELATKYRLFDDYGSISEDDIEININDIYGNIQKSLTANGNFIIYSKSKKFQSTFGFFITIEEDFYANLEIFYDREKIDSFDKILKFQLSEGV